jgi:Mn-dependent DtxR family transcriptional regulator
MAERITASEARRSGMLSLLHSDYYIEREGDALLLLTDNGSAMAAFSVEDMKKRAAKTAEEARGPSRRGRSTD